MRRKTIAIFAVGFLLAAYAAMIVSAAPVFREAVAVMRNEQITESSLQRYDTGRYGNEAERSARVMPLLVVHNGRKGYAYVRYSYDVRDKDGTLLCASNGIFSKWEIEKKDGVWSVINITEKP